MSPSQSVSVLEAQDTLSAVDQK